MQGPPESGYTCAAPSAASFPVDGLRFTRLILPLFVLAIHLLIRPRRESVDDRERRGASGSEMTRGRLPMCRPDWQTNGGAHPAPSAKCPRLCVCQVAARLKQAEPAPAL